MLPSGDTKFPGLQVTYYKTKTQIVYLFEKAHHQNDDP